MSEKPRKNWKSRVVSLALCLSVGWMVYIEGLNLIAWYFSKQLSDEHPNLSVIPTVLRDANVVELTGARIEKFGFSFQTPWNEIERDMSLATLASITFKDGGGLLIFDPNTHVEAIKVWRDGNQNQYGIMARLLGSQTLNSNYGLMEAEASTTPADIKWWVGRVRNTRNMILLTFKNTNLGDADSIHRIDRKDFRGFQYGDPEISPYVVHINLFDNLDREYEIIISGKSVHRQVISQAQINGMIDSLVPLPAPAVSSSPASGD